MLIYYEHEQQNKIERINDYGSSKSFKHNNNVLIAVLDWLTQRRRKYVYNLQLIFFDAGIQMQLIIN